MSTKYLLLFGLLLFSKITTPQTLPNAIPTRSSESRRGVKETQTQEKTKSANQKADEGSKIMPCDRTAPCYVINEPQAKTEEQQAQEKSLDRLYRASLIATICGVLGALIGLYFLFRQTRLTRTAANAAKLSAESTAKQTEGLVAGQRAWIIVDTGEIPDNLGANTVTLDVRPIIRNIGKTPAWPKRASIGYRLVPNGEKLPSEPEYDPRISMQEIYAIVPADGYIQALHIPIPYSTIISARQESGILYVYGFIDYDDFTGQERQTRFCLVYHVPRGLDAQPRGWYMEINVPRTYLQST